MVRFFKQPETLFTLAALLASFAFFWISTFVPSLGRMTHGFIAYYSASRLLVEGRFGPQVYDNDWYATQVEALIEAPIGEILAPTLPTVSLLALPLTPLPPQLARDVWLWFNLVVLFLALGLLVHLVHRFGQGEPRWRLWLGLGAVAFLLPGTAANFQVGQAIIVFLALFVVALYGLISSRDWLAGLALALALVLKMTGIALWFLPLVQRRWRALGWGVGTIAVVFLTSLRSIGLDTWQAYAQVVWQVLAGPPLPVTAFQTTSSLFHHLFRLDPVWNPHPVSDWPVLAPTLTWLVTILSLAVTVWRGRTSEKAPGDQSTALFFAALVPLGVVLLPVGEEHHFVVLLVPIFILVDRLVQHPPPGGFLSAGWLLIGAALITLLIPIPYEALSFSPGWLVLVAYPRLYGAWLLWAGAIWQLAAGGSQSVLMFPGQATAV